MLEQKPKTINQCNVCNSGGIEPVFSITNLPLTGLFIPNGTEEKIKTYDQALMFCAACGHGQVKNILPPEILYDDTYTHRTSSSPISTRGNDFFYSYLLKIAEGRKFKSILEVGCNDLYLLNKVSSLGESAIGIDPIWKGKDHLLNPKTQVLGRFVEELNPQSDFNSAPDLIVSAHTFEHLSCFYQNFEMLYGMAADNCLFLIEVPSFDTLIKTERFDQVFHQHIQYTSEASMFFTIEKLGGQYLSHTYNYGYWGGTLLFAFQKTKTRSIDKLYKEKRWELKAIKTRFSSFQSRMRELPGLLESFNEPCYGFGGAQMLPVLAYHMQSDLSFLKCILDDNKDRWDCRLPGVAPVIKPVSYASDIKEANVLITALDSARPITRRLMELSPRRIVNPALTL